MGSYSGSEADSRIYMASVRFIVLEILCGASVFAAAMWVRARRKNGKRG